MGKSRKSDDQSETNFITENPPNILELVTEERRILMRNKIGVYKVIGSINQGKIKGLFIETYEWSYWITLRLFQPSILCDSNEKACCKENQNEINHMHLLRSLSLPTFLDQSLFTYAGFPWISFLYSIDFFSSLPLIPHKLLAHTKFGIKEFHSLTLVVLRTVPSYLFGTSALL